VAEAPGPLEGYGTGATDNAIHLAAIAPGPDAGQGRSLPGVFFFYEPSAVRLSVREQRPPFLGFLANACAIVGGVFAVSGMLDAGVYFAPALYEAGFVSAAHTDADIDATVAAAREHFARS
jgi:hypothetical protein